MFTDIQWNAFTFVIPKLRTTRYNNNSNANNHNIRYAMWRQTSSLVSTWDSKLRRCANKIEYFLQLCCVTGMKKATDINTRQPWILISSKNRLLNHCVFKLKDMIFQCDSKCFQSWPTVHFHNIGIVTKMYLIKSNRMFQTSKIYLDGTFRPVSCDTLLMDICSLFIWNMYHLCWSHVRQLIFSRVGKPL